jgi:hypothetical protein
MPPLISTVLSTIRVRRGKSELGFCVACGDTVRRNDPVTRLRGGDLAHRDCATYKVRESRRRGPVGRPATTP